MSCIPCLNTVPRLELGISPTPLHLLPRLSSELEQPIYIKRDDLNGLGSGGNKVRNLEYLLAQAVEQGCDTIFASGPLQSNLCALTAAACARLGLLCRITARFRGEGWGHNTPESERALRHLARTEGILTEHVYNSKVLAALEQEVRQGLVSEPVCFLHTGGIGSLYALPGHS